MKPFSFFFATCCIILCKASNKNNGTNYPQSIRAALLENYDRISGPLPFGNMSGVGPVNITVVPYLYIILDVNVAQQTLSMKQWFDMIWIDPNLQWDPAMYGGVETIMVQRNTIWLPDVVIFGQISITERSDKLSLAQIYSDGTVVYSSDQVATVSCRFDVTDFPYDTQNCSVQYASWMYLADQILLIPRVVPDFSYFIENDEWTLRNYTERSENWLGASSAFYDIKITRKPNYYITTFILPTFLINCLSIIGIFSPFSESGKREEKVTMGLTTLLTMAVILMIIAGDMPSADGVPLLGIFIMVEIGLASFASVVSVFVINMHSKWINGTPVPKWLLRLTFLSEKERDDLKTSVKSTQSTSKQAWQNKDDTAAKVKTDPKQLISDTGIVEIRKKQVKIEEYQHHLREEWGKVAGRIDLILMAIFLATNIIFTALLLAIGNSKLSK